MAQTSPASYPWCVAKTRCLLIYPKFSEFSFWNFASAYRVAGLKYQTTPLGLLTVAALLPADWECRLVDLNVSDLSDADLEWAHLVMTGGMITQQLETVRIIKRAQAKGKPVAVGGPDATHQPQVYQEADFIVSGEGEVSIPKFVAAWESGARSGSFGTDGVRPDLERSPKPRFDLARVKDYLYLGVQFSRGCPNNCEFCDIIELFGREPRTKTPERLLAEFDSLYESGYRGHLDFVDDNLIGPRNAVKRLLRAIIEWSEARGWPFYFSAQATLGLARDAELLELMRRCDFRYVFIGIETPDPELLRGAGKSQNSLIPISECVRRMNEAGIMVMGGFILGFDNERPGAAEAIASCLEESGISTAMIGLLTSLPGTQLDDRLIREGRLLVRKRGAAIRPGEFDQMTAGLNFTPLRPRQEILREYRAMLARVYSPSEFFGRVRVFIRRYRPHTRHKPPLRLLPGMAWTMIKVFALYLARPSALFPFLATAAYALLHGPRHFAIAAMTAVFYVHLRWQTRHVVEHLADQIRELETIGEDAYIEKRGGFLYKAEPPSPDGIKSIC
ncbi:MAG: DUF4070 domain-containing protein [Elusimicrobiota bacterium]